MSKGGNWVPLDKSLVKTLGTLDRPYSEVEAMFSHTVNVDCGRPWTYRGYAKVWQWSVGKVKRFVEGMMNTSGTVVGRKGNGSGTEVHFIDKGLWVLDEHKVNGSGTVDEHKRVAISNPNPKPKKKTCVYSDDFEKFWLSYPRKIGKGIAFKSWNKIDTSNGMVEKILKAVDLQKKSESWQEDNGKYIPHPTTWLNHGRWEDEVEAVKPKSAGYDACESLF